MALVFSLCVFEAGFEDVLKDVQSIYFTTVNGKHSLTQPYKQKLTWRLLHIRLLNYRNKSTNKSAKQLKIHEHKLKLFVYTMTFQ